MRSAALALLFVLALLPAGCRKEAAPADEESTAGNAPTVTIDEGTAARSDGVRDPGQIVDVAPDQPPAAIVEEFGHRMKLVSTLAPENTAAAAIREHYSGLVSPDLLRTWTRNPRAAPGRLTSSPWPERIDVTGTTGGGTASAVVTGAIVEASSTGETAHVPVRVELSGASGKWLITKWEAAARTPPPPPESGAEGGSAADAVSVVRDYYAAIGSRDYARAYDLWGPKGPAGQSREDFARGFEDTAAVRIETGEPSRIEGAAGSRYVDVPVHVTATTRDGSRQEFEGTYTLRRAVVDGATAAQRRWHIESASIRKVTSFTRRPPLGGEPLIAS